MDLTFIFTLIVLIFSIVIHEVAHGYAANALGDPTARLQGRLTLNPVSHVDPLGSILIPGLLILSNASILFGWAKPVPYNPYNLRNQRWGEAMVAAAGPAVNLVIAIAFGLLLRFGGELPFMSPNFQELAGHVVYMNILLALFNLIPLPPLDGSKILF
jgi:Zn-dependent protease